jgi:hypothetical protein
MEPFWFLTAIITVLPLVVDSQGKESLARPRP